MALATDCAHIAYSDLDHVLRWASLNASELELAMTHPSDADLMIIGRSPRVFASEPDRLRATEGAVNQAASLALGLGSEVWDFKIAFRLMTRATASVLVEHCGEESIANDVVWAPARASRGQGTGSCDRRRPRLQVSRGLRSVR